MSVCKKCQSNDVKTFLDDEILKYKGAEMPYQLAYSVCQNCGREFISTAQIKANDCRVREAKKIHDGLLSAEQIKQAREALGLTQAQASQVFGGGRNAFSKYERAEVAQSVAMDKLIRVSMRYSFVLEELLIDAGISSKSATQAQEYSDNIIYIPQKNDRNKGSHIITKTELIDSKEEIEWTKVS